MGTKLHYLSSPYCRRCMKILHRHFLAASTVAYVNSYLSLNLFKQAFSARHYLTNLLPTNSRTRFSTTKQSIQPCLSMSLSSSPKSRRESISLDVSPTPSISNMISSIYGDDKSSRNVFSLYVTGGGVQAISWLLSVPGSSRSVMNVAVPYSHHALSRLMPKDDSSGGNGQGCTRETAILMAKTAYTDALNCFSTSENSAANAMGENINIFGVACTAALVSATAKKGDHRCHVAIVTHDKKISYSVTLDKSLSRTRLEEDRLCSHLILDAIAKQSGVDANIVSTAILSESGALRSNGLVTEVGANLSVIENPLKAVSGESPPRQRNEDDHIYSTTESRGDFIDRICSRELTHAILYPRSGTSSSRKSDGNSSSGSSHSSISSRGNVEVSDSGSCDSFEGQFVPYPGLVLPTGTIVYPGSFNPLHKGHICLVETARQKRMEVPTEELEEWEKKAVKTGEEELEELEEWEKKAVREQKDETTCTTPVPLVVFEIAVVNADKPPLPRDEILKRLQQFRNLDLESYAVAITSQPLFVGKSEVFPRCNFLIGADTFSRLMDCKYYHPPTQASATPVALAPEIVQQRAELNLLQALSTIDRNGCSFIVAGRVAVKTPEATVEESKLGGDGQEEEVFETFESIIAAPYMQRLSQLSPSPMGRLFVGLSEGEFRIDLSSTQIRKMAEEMVVSGEVGDALPSRNPKNEIEA